MPVQSSRIRTREMSEIMQASFLHWLHWLVVARHQLRMILVYKATDHSQLLYSACTDSKGNAQGVEAIFLDFQVIGRESPNMSLRLGVQLLLVYMYPPARHGNFLSYGGRYSSTGGLTTHG